MYRKKKRKTFYWLICQALLMISSMLYFISQSCLLVLYFKIWTCLRVCNIQHIYIGQYWILYLIFRISILFLLYRHTAGTMLLFFICYLATSLPTLSHYRWDNPSYSASIYLLKVNKRNTRTRCEICSKLTI